MTSQLLLETDTPEKIRLLIVEDEYILAINLQECLESLGYTVVDVVDAAETAIEKVAELRPTLVLMDIRLRGHMDGIHAAEQIWHRFQIPVIYVTGHSDKGTVERATLSFPFGYILKPVRDKELYVAIQTALSRYEREQFLSTILQGMGDGVVVTNTQLQVKYLNPAAERLTGWRLSEAMDQDAVETIQFIDELSQQPIQHPMALALQQDAAVYLNGHTFLVCKTGATLPIIDSALPLKDQYGKATGVVMVFRDDTQRRLMETHERNLIRTQQIELQLQEMQRLDALKDDFLATTSHELRTPLSNIKLAVAMLETVLNQQGLLKRENFSGAATVTRYLEVLHDQCDQELRLVNDLLDMRSLEANAYPLDPTCISLRDWLSHVAESFEGRFNNQNQSLQVIASPDLPSLVSDTSALTRIVSELLNNACKYTPAHEQIQLIAQLVDTTGKPVESSSLNAQKTLMQIVVRNSGVEISNEHLSKIFEPFYRIPSNDPWKHGGTGLGLALVKKFVEHLQGTITATSDQKCVIFTIQLPLTLSVNMDWQ